jgi:hypothetical protein
VDNVTTLTEEQARDLVKEYPAEYQRVWQTRYSNTAFNAVGFRLTQQEDRVVADYTVATHVRSDYNCGSQTAEAVLGGDVSSVFANRGAFRTQAGLAAVTGPVLSILEGEFFGAVVQRGQMTFFGSKLNTQRLADFRENYLPEEASKMIRAEIEARLAARTEVSNAAATESVATAESVN